MNEIEPRVAVSISSRNWQNSTFKRSTPYLQKEEEKKSHQSVLLMYESYFLPSSLSGGSFKVFRDLPHCLWCESTIVQTCSTNPILLYNAHFLLEIPCLQILWIACACAYCKSIADPHGGSKPSRTATLKNMENKLQIYYYYYYFEIFMDSKETESSYQQRKRRICLVSPGLQLEWNNI